MRGDAVENRLARMADLCLSELRGYPDDPAFVAKAISVLGKLPSTVGATAQGAEGVTVLCVGPDTWWLRGSPAEIARVEDRLRQALDDAMFWIVRLSPGIAAFRLSGPDSAGILAKGSSIDLRPRPLPPPSVWRTLHAGAGIVIFRPHAPQAPDTYELYVEASLALYIWTWLLSAGEEYVLEGNS